jgi:hypothetical protein
VAGPLNPNQRQPLSTRFSLLRQSIILALGVFVIIDASLVHAADLIEWTAGLVLIGIVPIDAIFTWWHNGHSPPPSVPSPPPSPSPSPSPPSDPPAAV